MNKFKVGDTVKINVPYSYNSFDGLIGIVRRTTGTSTYNVDFGQARICLFSEGELILVSSSQMKLGDYSGTNYSVKVTVEDIYGPKWLDLVAPEGYEFDSFGIINNKKAKVPYLRIDGGLGFSDPGKPWGFPRITLKKIEPKTAMIEYIEEDKLSPSGDYGYDNKKQKYFRIIRKEE